MSFETVDLKRDCEAVGIPDGNQIVLRKGVNVRITQVAGGAFTVMTELGQMASISGPDADALGQEPPAIPQAEDPNAGGSVNEKVIAQLKTCFDPEIPVNVVDLGLVYDQKLLPLEKEGENRVEIQMTLTAPGCGMGAWLQKDIETKLLKIPEVSEVQVDLVWDPPWDRSRMSEAAKLQLGM